MYVSIKDNYYASLSYSNSDLPLIKEKLDDRELCEQLLKCYTKVEEPIVEELDYRDEYLMFDGSKTKVLTLAVSIGEPLLRVEVPVLNNGNAMLEYLTENGKESISNEISSVLLNVEESNINDIVYYQYSNSDYVVTYNILEVEDLTQYTEEEYVKVEYTGNYEQNESDVESVKVDSVYYTFNEEEKLLGVNFVLSNSVVLNVSYKFTNIQMESASVENVVDSLIKTVYNINEIVKVREVEVQVEDIQQDVTYTEVVVDSYVTYGQIKCLYVPVGFEEYTVNILVPGDWSFTGNVGTGEDQHDVASENTYLIASDDYVRNTPYLNSVLFNKDDDMLSVSIKDVAPDTCEEIEDLSVLYTKQKDESTLCIYKEFNGKYIKMEYTTPSLKGVEDVSDITSKLLNILK